NARPCWTCTATAPTPRSPTALTCCCCWRTASPGPPSARCCLPAPAPSPAGNSATKKAVWRPSWAGRPADAPGSASCARAWPSAPPGRARGHRAVAARFRLLAQPLALGARGRAVFVLLPTGRQPGDGPSLAASGQPGLAAAPPGAAPPGPAPPQEIAGVAAAAEELAG